MALAPAISYLLTTVYALASSQAAYLWTTSWSIPLSACLCPSQPRCGHRRDLCGA